MIQGITIDLLKIWLPIAISMMALLFSFATLCWTIYRDAVRKPKFRVTISTQNVHQKGKPASPTFIALEALNLGPVPNRVMSTYARKSWLNRKIINRKFSRAFIYPDAGHVASTPMAQRIEVGDQAVYAFPYDEKAFLKENFDQVGISDGYGRMHWAPHGQLKKLRKKHFADFGAVP